MYKTYFLKHFQSFILEEKILISKYVAFYDENVATTCLCEPVTGQLRHR